MVLASAVHCLIQRLCFVGLLRFKTHWSSTVVAVWSGHSNECLEFPRPFERHLWLEMSFCCAKIQK